MPLAQPAHDRQAQPEARAFFAFREGREIVFADGAAWIGDAQRIAVARDRDAPRAGVRKGVADQVGEQDLRFEQEEDGTVAYLPLRKGAGLSPASRTPSALRAGD